MLCYVVVFVLLLYYKLVGMQSISLDGYFMSCTCVQTFIEKKSHEQWSNSCTKKIGHTCKLQVHGYFV